MSAPEIVAQLVRGGLASTKLQWMYLRKTLIERIRSSGVCLVHKGQALMQRSLPNVDA